MNRCMLRTASLRSRGVSHIVPGNIGIRRRAVASIAFNWEDPLAASELYTEEELAVQDTARKFSQERLLPRVLGVCIQHPTLTFLLEA